MGKINILCLVTFLCLIFVQCESGDNVTHEDKEKTVLQKWENFESRVQNLANQMIKMVLPKLMEGSSMFNISSACERDTMKLIGGIKKLKYWAIKFVDSSAKMLDGILSGTISAYGAYDQCINAVAINERKREKEIMFTGKYCTLEIKPPLPPRKDFYKLKETLDELKNFTARGTAIGEAAKLAHFFYFVSFRIGICVPSGCSVDDINHLAVEASNFLGLSGNVTRCEVKEDVKLTSLHIGIISAFGFAGLLMFVGSMIDIYCHYKKKQINSTLIKMFQAFSLISNFRKFVNTSFSSDTLSCLNGIRFLCMSWVVLGHTYLTVNYQILQSLESVTAFAADFAFQAVVNASVAVDTFFFIGGLLVCYLAVKLVVLNNKPFSLKLYIFHRLWRIIPVYAFVIGYTQIVDITGSGPIFYDTLNKHIQACRDNWWSNFLFINNFYRAESMCIPQSWYLSTDMQLYIASIAVLLPLFRWPKVGLSIAGVGIFMSMAASGILTYLNNYPPAMLFVHPDPNQRNEYWANFYFKPYPHVGPYCIGIISGYILVMHPKLKIPKVIQILGWSLAFTFCMSVLYGVWEWNKGVDPTLLETIFYSSCNRVAWTLGVAWMVICCCTGHGGIINYILSWKIWVPLGRLTFVVYLIHPLVQVSVVANFRGLIYPAHYFAVWVYCGHLLITYATAFAGSMLVEAPFLALEKVILPRDEKKNTDRFKDANPIANGDLKISKNGDISTIVHMSHNNFQEFGGTENRTFVYKL